MKVIFNNKEIEVRSGTVSKCFAEEIKNSKYEVIGCLYNNEYRNLETEVESGAKISLIDTSSKEGMKIYIRTLVFIMGKAFEKLYPKEKNNGRISIR